MRRLEPLGLVVSGVALSTFGLVAALLSLWARSRCIEAGIDSGLYSCVPFPVFWFIIFGSGLAIGIAGALLLRRVRISRLEIGTHIVMAVTAPVLVIALTTMVRGLDLLALALIGVATLVLGEFVIIVAWDSVKKRKREMNEELPRSRAKIR